MAFILTLTQAHTSSVTSQPVSSASIAYTENDFDVTPNAGCIFMDNSTGQTYILYLVRITNLRNEPAHYENSSVIVSYVLSDGSLANYVSARLIGSPNVTKVITIQIAFPIAGAGFGGRYVISAATSHYLLKKNPMGRFYCLSCLLFLKQTDQDASA